MTSVSHSELIDDQLHVPFRWVQESDPGNGADHPGHFWVKLSTGAIKRRKDDDSGWDDVGGAPGALSGTIFTTKGDLLTATGSNAPVRKAAGTDGYFLRPKAANSDGLEWYDHEGASDPHPQYTTNGEATTIADTEAAAAVSAHIGLSDPHAQYLKESVLTAKGDLYVATASGVVARLPIGTDGDVLTADSGATPGVSWQTPSSGGIAATIIDAKGDLLVGTADNIVARLPVGSDGKVLQADSGATEGVSWQTPTGGGASIDSDIYANLPAAGTAGNLYLPTDAPVLLRDDGAAWQTFGPIYRFVRGGWPATAYNHVAEVVTDHGWGQSIVDPANGSTGSVSWKGVEKVAPGTPWRVDLFFRHNAFLRANQVWGIFIRDSGTAKWTGLQINFSAGLDILHMNSATSLASAPLSIERPVAVNDLHWRMEDDATNLKFSCSADGVNWQLIYSEARASFLTTPDRVGWALNNQTNTLAMSATLLSWYEH
jgi:hypothetical protein